MQRAGRRTRVKFVEGDAELAQAREELGLRLAVDGVVDALVGRRLDVPVGAADADDLRNFPAVVCEDSESMDEIGRRKLICIRHEVGDPETLELSLLVEVVHTLHSDLKGCVTVGSMEVEDIDGTRPFTQQS